LAFHIFATRGAQGWALRLGSAMMADMQNHIHSDRAFARSIALAGAVLFALSNVCAAEEAAPLQLAPEQAQKPATLPTPQETFGAIGRLIDRSISGVGAGVNASVKGAGETLGATSNAAGELAKGVGDAAGTVARLPTTNIVTGREVCSAAPNGAPDCTGASLALCRSKGFERGQSLDITSAYKCPAQLWREGRAPNDRECSDESFVSKAVCQ
jgi:hypothetical protein